MGRGREAARSAKASRGIAGLAGWLLRSTLAFTAQLLMVFAVALAIALNGALLIELAFGGPFSYVLSRTLLVIGCFTLMMAPAGQSRGMRTGRIRAFGVRAAERISRPDEMVTAGTAGLLFLSGLGLLALGCLLAY